MLNSVMRRLHVK